LTSDIENYYSIDLGKDMRAIAANLKVETGFAYAELEQFDMFFKLQREAYMAYKNQKNAYWAWNSFKNFNLAKRSDLAIADLKVMAELINSTPTENENSQVLEVYGFWYEKNAKFGGDAKLLKRDYDYLVEKVSHDISRRQIIRAFNIQMAQKAAGRNDHKWAMHHVGLCLDAYPDDALLQRVLVEEFLLDIRPVTTYDSVKSRFDRFTARYPSVIEENTYVKAKIRISLIEIQHWFEDGKETEGLKAIEMFNNYRALHKEAEVNDELLGIAFTAASQYYSRKFQKKKARIMVERGLMVNPNNSALLYRQEFLEKYQ
jgi:hypothetical protein